MPKRLSDRELAALKARYPQPMPLSDEPSRHERHMRLILQDMNKIFDHVEAVSACEVDPQRDEALLDALQTARYTLTAADGLDGRAREARVRAALDEALRLMAVRTW